MQIREAVLIVIGVFLGIVTGHFIICGFHFLMFALKEKERREEFRKALEKREKENRPG